MMDKNFKIPPIPTEGIKSEEGVPEHLQYDKTVEEMRAEYIEKLKELTNEEGIEVLQNLEINDKNLELSVKMAQIEQEMEQRKIILRITHDKDTNEIKNLKSIGEFKKLKEDTFNETKKELTKTSKYIKGMVGTGIVLLGTGIDALSGGGTGINETLQNITGSYDAATVIEIIALLTSAVGFVYNSAKGISQERKSVKVTNQKVQRILGMIGLGMEKTMAQSVVGVETKKDTTASLNPLSSRYAQNFGYDVAGKVDKENRSYSNEQKELISQVRKTLDEMGIRRVSREKNQG